MSILNEDDNEHEIEFLNEIYHINEIDLDLEKIKNECDEIQNMNEIDIDIFFKQIKSYPNVLTRMTKDLLKIVISSSEKYNWIHKEQYYDSLIKISQNSLRINKTFRQNILSAFIELNKDITNLININSYNVLHNFEYETVKQIGNIFYDQYKFPIYYRLPINIKNDILDKIYSLTCLHFDIKNKIISGSLVLSLFLNEIYDDCDLDIWVLNNEIDININNNFYSACFENFCYIYNLNTSAQIKKIQIMNFGFTNGFSLINTFDLDINKIFISENGLYVSSNAYEQIINKKINCENINEKTCKKLLTRLAKYKSRGFELINLNENIILPEYTKVIHNDFNTFMESVEYIEKNKWIKNEIKFTNDIIFETKYLSLLCNTKFIKLSSNFYKKKSFFNCNIILAKELKKLILITNEDIINLEITNFFDVYLNVSASSDNNFSTMFEICTNNIFINGKKINFNKTLELLECSIIITYIININIGKVPLGAIGINITKYNVFHILG